MATQQMLSELADVYQRRFGHQVLIESVGGVVVEKRVESKEYFDFVILSSDAIDRLIAEGHIRTGSKVDLVHSGVAVAVKKGVPLPDISSEEKLRSLILSAKTISYSTGPSGRALATLFSRWGITDTIKSKIIQPKPGIPVGTLIASGEVELGFQQLSEFIHIDGISIVGALPPEIQIITTFSGAICTTCHDIEETRAFLEFLKSADSDEAKKRQGMEPA